MKMKICSVLLALIMLVSLVPAASASEQAIYTLTIEYYIQESDTKIAPSYKASLPGGKEYTVESPAVVGYKVADESAQTVSGTLNEDTTVKVYYTAESETASYTINYIGRKIDGTVVTPDLATVTGETFIGEIVTAKDRTFEGYVRDPGDLSLRVTGDGNAVLNVYYTETVNPCIVFSTGGNAVDPITAAAGTDISELTANRNGITPEKQGYIFAGWDWNGDGVHDDNDTPLIVMPENDLVIKAIWKPGTSEYIVEYYFQDTQGDGYTRNDGMDEVRQSTTGSTVTVTNADEKKGETIDQEDPFYGFDYSHCVDTTVTADGQAILKLYYDREIWTIKLIKRLCATAPLGANTAMTYCQNRTMRMIFGRPSKAVMVRLFPIISLPSRNWKNTTILFARRNGRSTFMSIYSGRHNRPGQITRERLRMIMVFPVFITMRIGSSIWKMYPAAVRSMFTHIMQKA